MPGTQVRRRPLHAANPWRLVPETPRHTLRTWMMVASLGVLAVLAALGPLMVHR